MNTTKYNTKYNIDPKLLIDEVKQSKSCSELLTNIGWNNRSGSLHVKIRNEIKYHNIDTSHWLGHAWSKGKTVLQDKRLSKKTVEEIFSENSLVAPSHIRRLVKINNLLPYECVDCKMTEWNNKPLTLQLDHINGIRKDNRLSNLRWMCPNCHSQTDTFCSKNRKVMKYKEEDILKAAASSKDIKQIINILGCNTLLYPRIRKILIKHGVILKPENKILDIKACDCGKIISNKNKTCFDCYHISTRNKDRIETRKVIRPTKEILQEEIKNNSFLELGRKYKVSDNAIRKWCKHYGLEYRKRVIIKNLLVS